MQIPVWNELQSALEYGNTFIATGYFNKVRSYKKLGYSLVPISGGLPPWFHQDIGTTYWLRRLAPKWKLHNEWKEGKVLNDEYIKCYYAQVLDKLKPKKILEEIKEELRTDKFVLICYEKPFDFCHRYLVAHWLQSALRAKICEVDTAKSME